MSEETSPDISHDQHAVRRQKLAELRAAGSDPFRAEVKPTHFSAEAIAAHVEGEDNAITVTVAGRIVTRRDMGKSQFVKILDQQGIIQLYVKKDVIGEAVYPVFKKLDLGDFIGVTGTLFKTRTGEITVRAHSYVLVAKALRPLPEKFHGLADAEQVYRQRYLDLVVNAESRERLITRSKIVSQIRRFLEDRNFLEVETPVLQNVAGGAAARPFETHHNALSVDFVLRISLELYLKRLLVGGIDRVFEIGRNFRNEGISRRHNPEFTMLEVYQAYSDYRGMMTLVKDLIQCICYDVLHQRSVTHQATGEEIHFFGEWREVTYKQLLIDATGEAGWFELPRHAKIAKAESLGCKINPAWEDFEITNEIFGKKIEPTLIQPTFVTHLPKELCPLAKLNQVDPSVLDVFELTIGGMEIAPAYSEQNDPDVQRAMFEAQAGEEQQNIDHDFLLALEHGMPPAGGMGIGIDRLCILLTGAESIRDVILFPQLRPGGSGA
ncbi:lysine--tRNA ligase [Synoicihabitans lomoniglobus]|uniref:Lysine--tRNA ligase n=1 Tax=Synoicihabitans lomoniglobus TaxID=2909285 RepID=A0AAF0CLM5_9BACT|nr:lysine--tRNA ligase [Opitutaceae bacterium LMO-M01]WED63063.1 lysine--tRNA ligase [Opitutaceae bacterium LMO-M01]